MRQHLLILSMLANMICVESVGQEKSITMFQTDQKNSSIIADNAKLELISSQFAFTEGPASDKHGNVFFTDQPNNRIWKYSIDGKLSIFLENAGRSNGMYFDKEENLITCADEHNQLWQIKPDGKTKILLNDFGGFTSTDRMICGSVPLQDYILQIPIIREIIGQERLQR